MGYVAVRLHNGASLSGGAARLLVGYALRRTGKRCWPSVGIDAFSGGGETLLIARPEAVLQACFADYALPLLQKYLTNL